MCAYYYNNHRYRRDGKKTTVLTFERNDGTDDFIDSHSVPSQAHFSHWRYEFGRLPNVYTLEHNWRKFSVEDEKMICPLEDPTNPDPDLAFKGCSNYYIQKKALEKKKAEKAKKAAENNNDSDSDSESDSDSDSDSDDDEIPPQLCWCRLIHGMIHQGGEVETRILLREYDTSNYYLDYYMLMNITGRFMKKDNAKATFTPSIEERKKNWNKYQIHLSIEFKYYFPDRQIHKPKKVQIYYFDKDNKKVKFKTDVHSISSAKIAFQVKKIPGQFFIKHGDKRFSTNDIIFCNDKKYRHKNPCRPVYGLCWCSVVNMLRSKGKAYMNIKMVLTEGTSYENHYMIFQAVRDPDNHESISISIQFKSKYNNTAYDDEYNYY